ncbi:MAG: outer membrane beta-barrel domain-containing protein [Bdellovibrionales bacterium]|nr:outer membrane beta-barrel domain-containing protein [Bdellovibrionales bacterium]
MLNHLCVLIVSLVLALPFVARAQDLEGSPPSSSGGGASTTEPGQIEELYDKEETKVEAKRPAPVMKQAPKQVQNLSDLATLAPFEDVAVIQRRFLPKTKRFELTAGLFNNLNNPFFNILGANVRAAYYLREQYAIEGIAAFATNSARQVTNDLEANRKITTSSVVSSKGFYAVAFKWNPIYGKITWLNRGIVPFDLNFNAGFGTTTTTDNQQAPTIHLGSSQVFALSKGMAFRWDIIWNTYQADGTDAGGVKSKITQNDLFLGVGMSFYFPEATYR